MDTSASHKKMVHDKYAEIAAASERKCCCVDKDPDYSLLHLDYRIPD